MGMRSEMERTTTKPWDPTDHLGTAADAKAYLAAALEGRDPRLVAVVRRDIARAAAR